MQAVVLFLNDKPDDPTKRLKLAGAQRYAAAAGWRVVPVDSARSTRAVIPALLAEFRPAGCICDDDGEPMKVTSGLFGGIPVVFANGHRSRFDSAIGRIGVDNKAVARAAFRELAAGNPAAFAVVGESLPREWSAIRVKAFREEAKAAGASVHVFREKPWRGIAAAVADLRPWLAALPRRTAVYAVNDPIARRIADAAGAAGLRIPQDLTLLGTDNDPAFCEASRPALSSIQLDFERMGSLAAKMLAGSIDRRPGGDGRVVAVGPMLAVRRESTGGRGRREPHVLEAVEIIRREACSGLTVARLASRLPGSRRLLDLRFREAMGHSVHDEILQVRLERVFDLLRRPEVRIGVIADFSGFALHQLDTVFRVRFGCSLRAWRKLNAQP